MYLVRKDGVWQSRSREVSFGEAWLGSQGGESYEWMGEMRRGSLGSAWFGVVWWGRKCAKEGVGMVWCDRAAMVR